MVDISTLWAKSDPYCGLTEHMVQTGKCALELLKGGAMRPVANIIGSQLQLSADETAALMSYIAALHDIGKAHPYFQAKAPLLAGTQKLIDEGLIKGISVENLPNFRHEEYSEEIARRILPQTLDMDDELLKALAIAVGLHHQGKKKSEKKIIQKYCRPDEWHRLQDELNAVLVKTFSPPTRHISGGNDAAVYLAIGMIILSDWIASDCVNGAEDMQSAVRSRGLGYDDGRIPCASFCDMWRSIPRDGLRGVQKKIEELAKAPAALYIIEAPMGEGKSEAALYTAVRQMEGFERSGFYLALPTSATGNQMFKRVNALFSDHRLEKSRLVHGTAWMIDDEGSESGCDEKESLNWLAPLRRALLERFAVGTVDQAMLSVMEVKYGVLRLLGLANKVLILDEIHAYDTYMQTIIDRLLGWCKALGVPVVLLSATLPKKKKNELLKAYGAEIIAAPSSTYPLITAVSADGKVSEHPVEHVHMKRRFTIELKPYMNDSEATARCALESVREGGCVCVLVNTVQRAQDVYRCLIEAGGDAETYLYHARFTVERRNNIEKTVVQKFGKDLSKRPKKSILVATQVMEQSIDADFDAMITDIAPIDLLLQRMGRVHRFDGILRPDSMRIPRITVLTSENGYDEKTIYPGILMQRTEDLLKTTQTISTPKDIRALVERVYDVETDDDANYFEMWAKNEFKNQLEAANAEGGLLPKPNMEYPSFDDRIPDFFKNDDESANFSAKTRIGDGSTRIVLVPRCDMDKLPERPSRSMAKEYMLKSASISASKLGDPPKDAVLGDGLMAGVVFLPSDDGIARWNNYTIRNDDEFGVILEKE